MAKISDGIAILDSIAAEQFGYSPDVMGFAMFSVEMTECMIQVDDGIWFAAMVRTSGMKESESQLWKLDRNTRKQVERKPDLSADYAGNESHECDYNPLAMVLGLLEAFKTHPLSADECEQGEPLTVIELLDLTPDMFANATSNSNAISNRKIARKHDRSRSKSFN